MRSPAKPRCVDGCRLVYNPGLISTGRPLPMRRQQALTSTPPSPQTDAAPLYTSRGELTRSADIQLNKQVWLRSRTGCIEWPHRTIVPSSGPILFRLAAFQLAALFKRYLLLRKFENGHAN